MEYSYNDYLQLLKEMKSKTDFKPLVGVVLGSGLGDMVNDIKVVSTIPYKEIKGMPLTTNKEHKGQFILGYFNDIPLIIMQGRLHCYEGYSSKEVVVPIRLMGMMGIKGLVLSNACGGINMSFKPGDMMLIDDHISSLIDSPLNGKNIDEFGTRFPDMSEIYDAKGTDMLYKKGKELNLPVQRGVYMQFYGPQYESKAEIRMARVLGADACGMSTSIEAIASHHMGIKTLGIAFVSNMACGITSEKLNDEDVIKEAKKSGKAFSVLLKEAIKILGND